MESQKWGTTFEFSLSSTKYGWDGRGGLTQQRAGVRPCAVGALLRLDFFVLFYQEKRTKKKSDLNEHWGSV